MPETPKIQKVDNPHDTTPKDHISVPSLTVNDFDRPSTGSSKDTPVQPMDRKTAENHITEVGKHNVDSSKVMDRASEPYKVPDTHADRTTTLSNHKDMTTSSGYAVAKTFADSNGNMLRGYEHVDKKTGERMFYAAEKDGKFTPYKALDGGKSYEKQDANGKSTGEIIKPRSTETQRNPLDNPHTKTLDAPKTFDAALKPADNTAKLSDPGKAFKAPDTGESKPGFRPDGRQDQAWNSRPGGGDGHNKNWTPDTSVNKGPQDNPHLPTNPTVRPEFQPHNNTDLLKQSAIPYSPKPEGMHPQNTPDAARPFQRPEGRSDYVAKDAAKTDPGAAQRLADSTRGLPPDAIARHQNDMRDNAAKLALDAQMRDGARLNPGGQPRDIAGMQALAQALREGHTRDAVPPGLGLKPLDGNIKQFLDAHRSELQGRIDQTLRLNPELHSNIYRALSPNYGEFTGKLNHRPLSELSERNLAIKPGDGLRSINDAQGRDLPLNRQIINGGDAAIRNLAQFMDLFGRRELGLSRVPDADQSRLMIREALRNPRLDQSTSQDLSNSLQIQRLLNQRTLEAGQPQALTFKGTQLEAMRELIARVKDGNILSQDQQIARNLDGKQIANASLTLSGKILDATNADKNAEQIRAAKDQQSIKEQQANKDLQTNKQQNQQENKPDASQIRRGVSDETSTSKTPASKDNLNLDDKKNSKTEEESGKKKGEKRPDQMTENELTTFLSNKLRDQKEKAEKEKEKKEKTQDQDKKDPKQKTRIKYRVKENDTLSGIAASFLSDPKLAAAIFHINRTVIPVTTYNNKSYAVPPHNLMIWIPCDDDIETFKDSGVGKQYQHIGFEGVEYASADDELAARFGRRWFGPLKSEKDAEDKSTRRANIEKMLGPKASHLASPNAGLSAAERTARRANIEKVLGQIGPAAQESQRIRYTVRLGESLKSIALKHPSLQNVEMWKLLAAVNGMSVETDEKGSPISVLKRGMGLLMPTPEEIGAFRADGSLPGIELASVSIVEEADLRPFDGVAADTIDEIAAALNTLSFDPSVNETPPPAKEFAAKAKELPSQNQAFSPQAQLEEKRHSFQKWKQELSRNNANEIEEFFKNQDTGNRSLVLTEASANTPAARVVSRGSAANLDAGYKLSLEVQTGENWQPIVEYDMNPEACTHQSFNGFNSRSRILTLPSPKVLELAQNDIANNWKNYIALLSDS